MNSWDWGDSHQRMAHHSQQSPPYQQHAPWQVADENNGEQQLSSSTTAQTTSTSSSSFSSYGNQYQQDAGQRESWCNQPQMPPVQNQYGQMYAEVGAHQAPQWQQHTGGQDRMGFQYGQEPWVSPTRQRSLGNSSQPSYQSGVYGQQPDATAVSPPDIMQLATSSSATVNQRPNYDHLRVSVDASSGGSTPKTTSTKVVSTTTKKNEQSEHKKNNKKQSISNKSRTPREEAESKGESEQYEQLVQARIASLGVCPMAFLWMRVPGGYQCDGGSHWLLEEEVDAWMQNPMRVPVVRDAEEFIRHGRGPFGGGFFGRGFRGFGF